MNSIQMESQHRTEQEPTTHDKELTRLRAELEKRDKRLAHLGGVLRAKHLELLRLRCEDAPIARKMRALEIRVRAMLVRFGIKVSKPWKDVVRLKQRLKRSIQKRKERLGRLWKKQNPSQPPSLHGADRNI